MTKNKIFLIIIFTLLLSSCSSSDTSSSTSSQYGDMGEAEYAIDSNKDVAEEISTEDVANYKTAEATEDRLSNDSITKKVLQREVKYDKQGTIQNFSTDFDQDIDNVKKLVKDVNGYFEESSYYLEPYYVEESQDNTILHKNFTSIIKVPANEYQGIYNTLKQVGINITNESNVINKSEGYYSLKSQLEVKKIYANRLLDIINKTKSSEEYLDLYAKYFDLMNEIDSMESKLTRMENITTYSTINFTLIEELVLDENIVETIEDEESFLENVLTAIKKSISISFGFIGEIILLLAYYSGPVVLLIILVIIILPFRKKIKNLIIKYTTTDENK